MPSPYIIRRRKGIRDRFLDVIQGTTERVWIDGKYSKGWKGFAELAIDSFLITLAAGFGFLIINAMVVVGSALVLGKCLIDWGVAQCR